ncbi:cytochrome P450 [Scleroderma yunnanense]
MYELPFHSPNLISLVVLLASLWFVKLTYGKRETLPLPPGPPGNWLLQSRNIKSRPTFQLAKLIETYGPVFSVKRGSQRIVIIGRYKAAIDIMEKEGASLADRPRYVAGGEILSGDMRITFVGDADRLRRFRRAMHAHLQPRVAATYETMQSRHAKNLILDMLEDPENHQMHAKRYAASVTMTFTYGKTTPTAYTDSEVIAMNLYARRVNLTARPGASLVDSYPILKYVPYYLRKLRKWHLEELAFFQSLVDAVRRQSAEGEARFSLTNYLLENQEKDGLNDKEVAYIAGSMFGAGTDTTASAITFMIMSAALHPEAQAKVHEELDAVVGRNKLPTFADWENLPQLTAFMLENLRWRPIAPGGLPHRATKDVIWNGYVIPAGTCVIGNIWAIAHDPEIFPNPDEFDPQRWIDANGNVRQDLEFFSFGFGRRVCPGRHVANRSMFINTAYMLWSFRISEDPALPIDSLAFLDTIVVHPDPFKVIIEPRVSEDLLRQLCSADS